MTSEEQFERQLVQEARNALLKHYSAKSSNQTVILVTIAIALFSFSQTVQYVNAWPSPLTNLYYLVFLTLISFLTIRSLGRLFYWGQYAGLIFDVRMVSEKEVEKSRASSQPWHDMWKKQEITATYHNRLSIQCSNQLQKSMNHVFYSIILLTREPRCYLLFLLLLTVFFSAICLLSKVSIVFPIIFEGIASLDVLIGIMRYKIKREKKRARFGLL